MGWNQSTGGGGTVTTLTSTGHTITITNPGGPVTNLEVAVPYPGAQPLVVSDATANYTLAPTDIFTRVELSAAAAADRTFTVDATTVVGLVLGDWIEVGNASTSHTLSIAAAGGQTIESIGGALKLGPFGTGRLLFLGGNVWILNGSIST